MNKIPLFLISPTLLRGVIRKFYGVGSIASKLNSALKMDLKEAKIELDESEFGVVCLFNSLLFFLLFFSIFIYLNIFVVQREIVFSLLISMLVGGAIFIMSLFLMLRYPSIIVSKKAEEIEKNLIFALKDLLLQVSSGTSLYNAMISVSKSKYGRISDEFERISKKIGAGMSMEKALDEITSETKSEYLKRSMWQLKNAIRAGASLKEALNALIHELTESQRSKINDYAKELNLWSLVYLLFAVAIPTIGVVFLLILGSFANFDVTNMTFVIFLIVNVFIQVSIIGFIKSRRPVVQF